MARAAAMQMECKKHELRQLQNGEWKITFSIHPDEMPQAMMTAAMGTRFIMAVVEIGDDEKPVKQEERTTKKPQKHAENSAKTDDSTPPPKWGDMKPSNQAGIRCEQDAFRKYMLDVVFVGNIAVDNVSTAEMVRSYCGVMSRSELDSDDEAHQLWIELDESFRAWMKEAEVVG